MTSDTQFEQIRLQRAYENLIPVYQVDNNTWFLLSQRLVPLNTVDYTPFYVEGFTMVIEGIYPDYYQTRYVYHRFPISELPEGIYDAEVRSLNLDGDTIDRLYWLLKDSEVSTKLSDELQNFLQIKLYTKVCFEICTEYMRLSAYKFAVHNYLIEEKGVDCIKIKSLKVWQGKIFCSYYLKKGGKGATILSDKLCNPGVYKDYPHLDYQPIVDGYFNELNDDWVLPIAGYEIFRGENSICFVTANHDSFNPGYLRFDACNPDATTRKQGEFGTKYVVRGVHTLLTESPYVYECSFFDLYEAVFGCYDEKHFYKSQLDLMISEHKAQTGEADILDVVARLSAHVVTSNKIGAAFLKTLPHKFTTPKISNLKQESTMRHE